MLKAVYWFLYRKLYLFKRVIVDGDSLEHARYMFYLHGLDMATLRKYPKTPPHKLPSASLVPELKGAKMNGVIPVGEREPGHTRENGEPDDGVAEPLGEEPTGPK